MIITMTKGTIKAKAIEQKVIPRSQSLVVAGWRTLVESKSFLSPQVQGVNNLEPADMKLFVVDALI